MGFQCAGTTANGERCTRWAGEEGGFCWIHDPAKEDERQEARKKGGQRSARLLRRAANPDQLPGGPPETAEEAQVWASWVVFATASGLLDPTTSQKVSAALNTFLKAESQANLEGKVKDLASKLKELQTEGGK